MNKTQEKAPKKPAGRPKPASAPMPPPALERHSFAGERAEGEGMIAPPTSRERASELEGEGSDSAARRYDEGVERSVAKGDTERLAEEAARALDGPVGTELQKAEQAVKRGQAA